MESEAPVRVVVVDDESTFLKMAAESLRLEGMETVCAFSHEEPFEIIVAEQPDVVVTSLRMAGIDGFALCGRLKEDNRTRDIPVIITSAQSGSEYAEKAGEMGAAAYLVKPFAPGELVRQVRNALEAV